MRLDKQEKKSPSEAVPSGSLLEIRQSKRPGSVARMHTNATSPFLLSSSFYSLPPLRLEPTLCAPATSPHQRPRSQPSVRWPHSAARFRWVRCQPLPRFGVHSWSEAAGLLHRGGDKKRRSYCGRPGSCRPCARCGALRRSFCKRQENSKCCS